MKIPDVQLIGTTPGMKVISMAHGQNIVRLYIITNGNLFYIITLHYILYYGLWPRVVQVGHFRKFMILSHSEQIVLKTVNMATIRATRKCTLPSTNRWAYSISYKAVYESSKLHKEDLVGLCCQATHCIRLIHTTHGEDNGLYAIFAEHMGQDVAFI